MLDGIIIGGGAAGMTAAIRAASKGARILLLERGPRSGRKLLLTGGGRCNLAVDRDAPSFVADCGPAARFLHNALGRFDPASTRAWFRDLGVPTLREPDGRCFPASGRALDVVHALEAAMVRWHVEVRYESRVSAIRPVRGGLKVHAGTFESEARAVVIATGGRSYPETGSSGDGFDLAASLGHRIVPPRPGEVPLVAGPAWLHDLAGVGLDDVVARFRQGKQAVQARGSLLFTHFGVSGPVALDGSRLVARWLDGGPVELSVDLAPDRSLDEVDGDLATAASSGGSRHLKSLLRAWVPERLAQRLADRALPEGDGPVARLPAARRKSVAAMLKGLPLTITGTRGFAEAVVTLGGVDTSEVHPATMESRLVPGLHLAGEVLDVDGPRGGYNLQIAWSTGLAAGTHVAGMRS